MQAMLSFIIKDFPCLEMFWYWLFFQVVDIVYFMNCIVHCIISIKEIQGNDIWGDNRLFLSLWVQHQYALQIRVHPCLVVSVANRRCYLYLPCRRNSCCPQGSGWEISLVAQLIRQSDPEDRTPTSIHHWKEDGIYMIGNGIAGWVCGRAVTR